MKNIFSRFTIQSYSRLFLLISLALSFTQISLRAQEGFKGEKPSNPVVNRRPRSTAKPRATTARRTGGAPQNTETSPDPKDVVEDAIASGNTALDAKNYGEAESQYRRAIALNPQDSRAYYGLGNAYFYQTRYTDAIEPYKQAISLNSNDWLVYYYLGITYDYLFRHAEAAEAFQQAARLNSGSYQANVALGTEYIYLQKYTEAVEPLQQAIKLDANNASSHTQLGLIYRLLKRYDDAVQSLQQAIRLNPNAYEAYAFLGNVYLELKRYNEAIEQYRKAISLTPDYASAHYGLGIAYLLVNNKSGATEEYDKLRSLKSTLADDLKKGIETITQRDDAANARREEINRARAGMQGMSKEALYKGFTDNYKNNMNLAYAYATEYLQHYSSDNDQITTYLKRWVERYEAVVKQQ
jgi:tetratricopeptide (TPR) repeat protein